MDSNIKISIILPVYNAEKFIKNSIDSILIQSFKNFELLIINDGSNDNTESIVQSFNDPRIIYIKNEKNIGLISTLNKGIELYRGELIARIDADDIWIDADKLTKQVKLLESNPDYVLVGTQALFKKGESITKTNYPLLDTNIRKKILSKNVFIHSSVLFRKSVLEKDPYKKEAYLIEDYSLWLELGTKGRFANLPDYCVEYFVNPTGETQKHNLEQTVNSLNLIKKYKTKYPRYYTGVFVWTIKVYLRKILLHLK